MTRARDISRLLGRTDNEVDSEGEIIASSSQIVDSAFVLSQAPASSSFTFYSTLDSLPSNADEGQLAFVEANTRMYLNDGSGWYSIAAVNLSPSLTLSPSGTITLATDGSPATVTITATDTDDPSAILSYSVESDGNMLATGTTVTQDSSVFTITPITQAAGGVAGDFTLSFKVSDQIDEAVANKSFSLAFQSIGTLYATSSSVNEGGVVSFRLPATGYAADHTFPYTITGIQAADLTSGTLSGNMTRTNNNPELWNKTVYITSDQLTEGAQTMTFNAEGQSVNVTINDTSLKPAFSGTRMSSNNYKAISNTNIVYHNSMSFATAASNKMVAWAYTWDCGTGTPRTISQAQIFLGGTYHTCSVVQTPSSSNLRFRSAVIYVDIPSTWYQGSLIVTFSGNMTGSADWSSYRLLNSSHGNLSSPILFSSGTDQTISSGKLQVGVNPRVGYAGDFFIIAASNENSTGQYGSWTNISQTINAYGPGWGHGEFSGTSANAVYSFPVIRNTPAGATQGSLVAALFR